MIKDQITFHVGKMNINDLHNRRLDVLLERAKRKGRHHKGKRVDTPLARAMRDSEKSQDDLAKETDVHPSTMSRYKTGVRVPSHETLSKLVNVMGMKPGDMFPELRI